MMNAKQKNNGLVDVGLFLVFISTFLLDLTGVEIHQWLGIIAGAAAVLHLAFHVRWVQTVIQRFFGNTSMRSRLYFLLDGVIAIGFFLMILTGVMISTWLNLPLSNYDTWKVIHIGSSIATLAVVLVKLLTHWKWIACTLRRIVENDNGSRNNPVTTPLQPIQRERRDFLKVAGIVGVASAIALTKSFQSLVSAQPVITESLDTEAAIQTQVAQMVQGTQQAKIVQYETTDVVDVVIAQPVATSIPTLQPTATPAEVANLTSTSCMLHCNRGCSFPGHCRRFTDSNGNGTCDLTECV